MPQNEWTQIYLTKSLLTIIQIFQSFDFSKILTLQKKKVLKGISCVCVYIYMTFSKTRSLISVTHFHVQLGERGQPFEHLTRIRYKKSNSSKSIIKPQ